MWVLAGLHRPSLAARRQATVVRRAPTSTPRSTAAAMSFPMVSSVPAIFFSKSRIKKE